MDATYGSTVLLQLEVVYVFASGENGFSGESDAAEFFDSGGQVCQNFADGEIFFDFGFAECVSDLVRFFAGVALIPQLRVGEVRAFADEGFDFGEVFFGVGSGVAGKVMREDEDLFGVVGYSGEKRQFGVASETEQLGGL